MSIFQKDTYKNKYKRFKINDLKEELGSNLTNNQFNQPNPNLQDNNQTFDGPTFITFKPHNAERNQKSTLYRKKSLREATSKLKNKYNTTDTLELAKNIISEEKSNKVNEMRIETYNSDG